ncbi:MAG: hypothetical protein JXR12_14855 [Neptunomonas phycophila]|uniref:hypothetical protein n=1 Tax=Neptunomonas phycophila TaxID=1572645 RepID=UPI003B8C0A93
MSMIELLKELEQLGGIQHSCVATPDSILASTFPEILDTNMGSASRVAHQIFNAIHSIGSDHKEIIFELDECLLMGHVVDDKTVLIMMTEKEVNMALINTSVRSVMPTIIEAIAPVTEPEPSVVPDTSTANPPPVKNNPAIEAQLRALMNQLRDLMADYIGPAVSIVFDDAYDTWRATHGVRLGTIAELLKQLAREIDDKDDRSAFLKKSVTTVKAFSANR